MDGFESKKLSNLYLQSGFDFILYSKDGRDYSVRNPTLRDVIELEKREVGLYYTYLYRICTSSLDMAEELWCEAGIYYEDIKSEWAFFIQRALGGELRFIDTIVKENSSEIIVPAVRVCDAFRDAFNWFFRTTGEWILLTNENIEVDNMDNTSLVNVEETTYRKRKVYRYEETNYRLTFFTLGTLQEYLKKINHIENDYEFTRVAFKSATKKYLTYMYKQHQSEAKRGARIDLSSIVSSLVTRGQRYQDILDYSLYLIRDMFSRYYKIDNYNNTVMAYLQNGDPKNKLDFEKIDWGVIIK